MKTLKSGKLIDIAATLFGIAVVMLLSKSVFKVVVPNSVITVLSYGLLSASLGLMFVCRKQLTPIIRGLNTVSSLSVGLLLIYLFFDLIFPNELTTQKAVGISFLQFLFVPLFLLVGNNIPGRVYKRLIWFTEGLILLYLLVALIEFILPDDVKLPLIKWASVASGGKYELPVSYYVRDFNFDFYRLGSLFLEPVTLGFTAAFYAIYCLQTSNKWFSWKLVLAVLICIFTFAKLAIVVLLLGFGFKLFQRYSRILFFVGAIGGVVVIISTFDLVVNNSRSMANHYYGLRHGYEAGIEKPLGNGLGSSGYLVHVNFNPGDPGPFKFTYEFSERENGNESGVGVLLYQFGFPFAIAYLFLILFPFFGIGMKDVPVYSALILGLFLSLFLSESVLSVGLSTQCWLMVFAGISIKRDNVKKLAIVDHVGKKAGMDYFTGNLAQELAKQNELIVYSNFDREGVKCVQAFSGKRDSVWQKATDFYMGHLHAFWSIKSEGIDIVLFHSFETGLKELSVFMLAKVFGFKIGIIVHDVEGFVKGDSLLFKKIIYKKLASVLFSLNSFSKKILIDKLGPGIESRIVSIRHGHFLDQVNMGIRKEKALEKLGWDENVKYILFFGQIKKVKGLDLLIRAFKNTPNTRLVIAGKVWKDEGETYTELINSHPESSAIISHFRFITDEEREYMFKAADLIVIPYRKIYQSGVLLMAMSYGKAVLASDLPANREIIIDGVNGALFNSEDKADLSKKLSSLMSTPAQLESMGANALKTMKEEFNWNDIAATIANSILLA